MNRQHPSNEKRVFRCDKAVTDFPYCHCVLYLRLVLEAGAIGKEGEIFIFDMGKSVKILDLAKKMIQLSGLTLGKDIQIRYIGLGTRKKAESGHSGVPEPEFCL